MRTHNNDNVDQQQAASDGSRTKAALLQAFNQLVLSRPYTDVRVPDVVALADVSRSSFYQHFKNLDELFRHSFTPVLAILATTASATYEPARLHAILDHMREHKKLSVKYLKAPLNEQVGVLLSDLFLPHLITIDAKQLVANEMVAAQLAGSTMGLIRGWLSHNEQTSLERIAEQLHSTTQAIMAASQDLGA